MDKNAASETVIGVWRLSPFTGAFWWRILITVGLYYFFNWRRNVVTLTSRRVSQRDGSFMTSEEYSISLEKISDIQIFDTALGGMFNYADISIYSEGGDQNEPDIQFRALGGAHKLRDEIFAQQGKLGLR